MSSLTTGSEIKPFAQITLPFEARLEALFGKLIAPEREAIEAAFPVDKLGDRTTTYLDTVGQFARSVSNLSYNDARTVAGVLQALRSRDVAGAAKYLAGEFEAATVTTRNSLLHITGLLKDCATGAFQAALEPGEIFRDLTVITRLLHPGVNMKDPNSQWASFDAKQEMTVGLELSRGAISPVASVRFTPLEDKNSVQVAISDFRRAPTEILLQEGQAILVGRYAGGKAFGQALGFNTPVLGVLDNPNMSRGALAVALMDERLILLDRISRNTLIWEHRKEGRARYESVPVQKEGLTVFGNTKRF